VQPAESRRSIYTAEERIILKVGSDLVGPQCDLEERIRKGSQMELIAKNMSFAIVLSLTTALGPQASAQTQSTTTAPATQAQPTQQQQYQHPKARGAAGGAIIGGAMGNAGAGAVIGMGHSRREQRRANRHQGQ